MEVFTPKHNKLGEGFSKQEKLDSMRHPGRQTNPKHGYQSAVAFISDLIALRKVIILCSFCRAKFNPRRFGYRVVYVADPTGKTDGFTVNGDCDSCKGKTWNLGGGQAFQPIELYEQTHIDPTVARRNARIRSKVKTPWAAVQKAVREKTMGLGG